MLLFPLVLLQFFTGITRAFAKPSSGGNFPLSNAFQKGWFSLVAQNTQLSSTTSPNNDDKTLKEGIAKFYDEVILFIRFILIVINISLPSVKWNLVGCMGKFARYHTYYMTLIFLI